jgi:hypothetical protein
MGRMSRSRMALAETWTGDMKSKIAVSREYQQVKRVMKQRAYPDEERDLWYGFMQALAWVMDDDAAAPTTFPNALKRKPRPKRRKRDAR